MSWSVFSLFNWVSKFFSSFREYISGSTDGATSRSGLVQAANRRFSGVMGSENTADTVSRSTDGATGGSGFVPEVENGVDGVVADGKGCGIMEGENTADTVSDGKVPININVLSNNGIVIVGKNANINNGGTTRLKKVKDVETVSQKEFQIVSLGKIEDKGKRRRKRKPGEINPAPLNTTSVAKRINEIEKSLSKYRGNGKWNDHSNAVQKFFNEYRRDEHNADIILLLKYEEAAALCDKNETEKAIRSGVKLVKELKVEKRSNWEHMNNNKNRISCKCLFLTSKLFCAVKSFGIAKKALDLAEGLLLQYDNAELNAQLFLANAYLQFCLNQSNRTPNVDKLVIEFNKAENVSDKLKDRDQETWQRIRIELLILRCKAIVQFYLDSGDKEQFADVLNNSLEELENQLWNIITLRQKVDFHMLKIKILGSSAKAIDHAWDALRIAQECQFTKEVLWLKEHIRKQQIFPEDPANDTAGLLKMVFEIVTTTDGNLESNAAEFTDTGLFSSDDSEWDILTVDSFR